MKFSKDDIVICTKIPPNSIPDPYEAWWEGYCEKDLAKTTGKLSGKFFVL